MKSWIYTLSAFIFAILALYHLFILNCPEAVFVLGAISYVLLLQTKELKDYEDSKDEE